MIHHIIYLLIVIILLYLLINKLNIDTKPDTNYTNYTFIHVPKSGGTSIDILLNSHLKTNYTKIHLESIKPDLNEKYIIWIRNPITRFVSAFNFVIKHINEPFIYKYIKKDFNFKKIFNKFKNANDMAEKIYSDKSVLKLLSNDTSKNPMCIIQRWWSSKYNNKYFYPEDIFKGISWYLDNNFLINYHQNIIFCGQVEHMEEDINELCKLLNIKNTYQPYNINNIKLSKYLSPLAIKNLRKFYLNDYKCLEKLVDYGLLSKKRLEEYY